MPVLLSLGSNVGNRRGFLEAALAKLDEAPGVGVRAVSHGYETEAMGITDQSAFINLGAEIETDLEPLELLNALKSIEQAVGRTPSVRWGPREIDIDIILWDDRVIEIDGLTIPHSEFRRRAFVLAPLAEIAGEWVDPGTGLTVAELANRAEAEGRVRRLTN